MSRQDRKKSLSAQGEKTHQTQSHTKNKENYDPSNSLGVYKRLKDGGTCRKTQVDCFFGSAFKPSQKMEMKNDFTQIESRDLTAIETHTMIIDGQSWTVSGNFFFYNLFQRFDCGSSHD